MGGGTQTLVAIFLVNSFFCLVVRGVLLKKNFFYAASLIAFLIFCNNSNSFRRSADICKLRIDFESFTIATATAFTTNAADGLAQLYGLAVSTSCN